MYTYFKITKDEKRLVKKIYDMFLYKENFSHIKLVFYTWLVDNYNEIYITKENGKNGNWNYILVDNRNPYTDKHIVDIKSVLDTN